MKKQYLFISISIVLIIVPVCRSFAQLTEKQKLDIISKADSVIKRYNTYGTFVTEVGYFSSIAAREFKSLFDENAKIYNDLDIENENNGISLKPEAYVSFAQANFEKGLSDATFTKNEAETKINNSTIIFNGSKSLSAELNVNGSRKLFKREFDDFQIVISFDKDLKTFLISTIRRTKLPSELPVQNIAVKDKSLQILNAQGKVVPSKATLKVDGARFAMLLTDEAGYVNFTEVPVKCRITLDVTAIDDPSLKYFFDEASTNFFNLTNIVLNKEEKFNFTFRIQDEKSRINIPKAKISVQIGNDKYNELTDRSGTLTIPVMPNDKVEVTVTAERYNDYTQSFTVDKRDKVKTLYLKYIEDDQYLRVCLNGGSFFSNQLNQYFTTELTKSPVMGITAYYERFPYQKEKKSFQLGYYGSLSITRFNFKIDDNSIKKEYTDAYEDIDGDVATIIINAENISEQYNLISSGFSGGLLLNKTFSSIERLSLTGCIGPEFTFFPISALQYNVDSMSFRGRYKDYFNMELKDIDRYGYSTDDYEDTESGYFKPFGFGLSLGVNADYMINDKLGIGIGLNYKKVFSNLLKGETKYAAGIKINDGTVENYYNGLIKELENLKLDSFTLSLGIRYKLK